MNDLFTGLVIGMLSGLGIALLLVGMVMDFKHLTPCEAELPRSQHCKLVAVPVENNE